MMTDQLTMKQDQKQLMVLKHLNMCLIHFHSHHKEGPHTPDHTSCPTGRACRTCSQSRGNRS